MTTIKKIIAYLLLNLFPVEQEKLSNSKKVRRELFFIFSLIWFVIQLFITGIGIIVFLIWTKTGEPLPEIFQLKNTMFLLLTFLFPAVLATLLIFKSQLNDITMNLKMNVGVVLLNSLTGEKRAIFEGLNFILWWETPEYLVDLEISTHSEISETFPTQDGSMKATVSVMSKPNSAKGKDEDTRSRHLIGFVEHELATIRDMQTAEAKQIMREAFESMTCVEAKEAEGWEIIHESDFIDLEKKLHIDVIECTVSDVDNNKAVQEAQNSLSVASTLNLIVDELRKDGRHTLEQANDLAPLMMDAIKLERKEEVKKYGMSVELISLLKPFMETLAEKIAEKIK